ncbi:MAG TPA: ABC transporter ATP-binding protein [Azospirillaceae bacterium]|nr:ABC transporter ATP-binding protein [Azospirillaceae bacterium]
MSTDVPSLEVEGVRFGYGGAKGFALQDVGFTVPAGSFTGLLGVNGAGKSTLLGVLTRLFEPTAGTVRVCGHALADRPLRALAAMGVVFQQPTLDLDLTVRQNLSYAAGLRGMARRDADARIAGLLERFALADRAGAKVRLLNGGHRRRVELARALLHRPRLLILDEPTVGLDLPSRRALVEHVHALCREEGVAALWATHLIDEVRDGDRAVLIDHGRVVAEGAVPELLAHSGAASLEGAFQALTGRAAA